MVTHPRVVSISTDYLVGNHMVVCVASLFMQNVPILCKKMKSYEVVILKFQISPLNFSIAHPLILLLQLAG